VGWADLPGRRSDKGYLLTDTFLYEPIISGNLSQ
jgi:hypothetical protein